MIDWDKRNYPNELEGVPFRYVGKNVKLDANQLLKDDIERLKEVYG